MNAKFTGLGAEPKKLAFLGACVVVAAYFYFSSGSGSGPESGAGPGSPSQTASQTASQPVTGGAIPIQKTAGAHVPRGRGLQRGGGGSIQEFRPSLKLPKDFDLNRASIDPTLRLDLLEKLQKVTPGASGRSLFESLSAPPVEIAKITEPKHIDVQRRKVGPEPPPVKGPEVAKVEPPPPPIPLKFYGFISPKSAGVKRAFFLDGDDIIVATEGQLVKGRYKIVRIGVNSAVLEDTQSKNHQQTLPLVEEQTG